LLEHFDASGLFPHDLLGRGGAIRFLYDSRIVFDWLAVNIIEIELLLGVVLHLGPLNGLVLERLTRVQCVLQSSWGVDTPQLVYLDIRLGFLLEHAPLPMVGCPHDPTPLLVLFLFLLPLPWPDHI